MSSDFSTFGSYLISIKDNLFGKHAHQLHRSLGHLTLCIYIKPGFARARRKLASDALRLLRDISSMKPYIISLICLCELTKAAIITAATGVRWEIKRLSDDTFQFHVSGPRTIGYAALGIGSGMAGAIMYVQAIIVMMTAKVSTGSSVFLAMAV